MDTWESIRNEEKSDELNIPSFLVGKEFASIGYLESGFSESINYIICNGNNGNMSLEFKKRELSKLKNAIEILHSKGIDFWADNNPGKINVYYCEECSRKDHKYMRCMSLINLIDDLIKLTNKQIGIKIHKEKLINIGFGNLSCPDNPPIKYSIKFADLAGGC